MGRVCHVFISLCYITVFYLLLTMYLYPVWPITSSDASYLYHIKKHERFVYELFIGSNADIVDKRIHFSMKLLNSNCQNRRHVNIVINMKKNWIQKRNMYESLETYHYTFCHRFHKFMGFTFHLWLIHKFMGLKPKIKLPKIRTKILIKIIPGNIDSNCTVFSEERFFSLDQLKTRMHKSAIFFVQSKQKEELL